MYKYQKIIDKAHELEQFVLNQFKGIDNTKYLKILILLWNNDSYYINCYHDLDDKAYNFLCIRGNSTHPYYIERTYHYPDIICSSEHEFTKFTNISDLISEYREQKLNLIC